jgi:hypothetical protein
VVSAGIEKAALGLIDLFNDTFNQGNACGD